MAGASITITINDAPLQAAIDVLRGAPDHLYPALDAIGAAMEAKTRLRFREGVDPEGAPWKPSKRALKVHGQTLVKSGRLRDSITHNVTETGVEWGSNVVYAAIHQFGGTIHREAHSQAIYRKVSKSGELGTRFVKRKVANYMTEHDVGAYDITMPRRSFLGADADDLNDMAAIVAAHIEAALKSGTWNG